VGESASWDPRLTIWVDRVDEHWQALGISDALRARLRRELVTDLGQARLGGASVSDLTSPDPCRFAEDVATAETLVPETAATSSSPRRGLRQDAQAFVVLALAGAVAGGLLSLVTVYPIRFELFDFNGLTYRQQGIVTLLAHAIAAAIAVLAGAAAVRWHFRTSRSPGRLAAAAGLGLVISGALATLPTVALAWATDFSSGASVVALEITLVVFVCAYGLVTVARRVGLSSGGPIGPAPGGSASAS
jgi:hypothetical protein